MFIFYLEIGIVSLLLAGRVVVRALTSDVCGARVWLPFGVGVFCLGDCFYGVAGAAAGLAVLVTGRCRGAG